MKFKLTEAHNNPFFLDDKMEIVEVNTLEDLLNITDENIIIYKPVSNNELPEICIYNDYVE